MNWSAFWGAFAGNLADIATLILIIRLFKKFAQFKAEGEDDKWLK